MGGKGGGGDSGMMMMPTSGGYDTPEQARATLAAQAPLDLAQYQQTVDVQKAAREATAPPAIQQPTPKDVPISTTLADTILKPPGYWAAQDAAAAARPRPVGPHRVPTTSTSQYGGAITNPPGYWVGTQT
jgi:hypothetical protein